MLATMQDAPSSTGFRLDPLGIGLIAVGLVLGVVTRFLGPDLEACTSVSVWAAPALAGSVLAFGFGFARCLPDRPRRIMTTVMVVLVPIAVVLVIAAILARPEVTPGDCI
jgi:uncharacterized membrane protein